MWVFVASLFLASDAPDLLLGMVVDCWDRFVGKAGQPAETLALS